MKEEGQSQPEAVVIYMNGDEFCVTTSLNEGVIYVYQSMRQMMNKAEALFKQKYVKK